MLNMLPFYQQFTPHTHYYREDDWHCEACQLSNNINNPKPPTSGADGGVHRHRIRTTKVGDLVHIDPLGKQKSFSVEGHTTAMVIIDDYSRFAVVKLLKRKKDVQEAFRTYCLQYVKPLRVRCDGEAATMLHATCTKMDIILEPSIPQRQHQNGIVERYIGLLQEKARVFRVQSQVPDALNLHAIAYAAQMMRFLPQATRGFQTAYELANGFPHKKPDPVQAVFGCLVYAVNTRRLQANKVSKRTLKGVFIGFGNHDRLNANCRAIRIFCLERNAIILSDPLQCKFFNNIFPFQVMRTKAPHLDAMVKIRLKDSRGVTTMKGTVIAFEAPLYTIVLEDGRLVRARSGDLSTWIQAYTDRNVESAIVPIVEKNNLSRWEMGTTNLVASLTVAQARAPYDVLDPRGFVRDPVGLSLRAHGGFVVPDFEATLAHRPDAARGFHDGRIHMRGDTLALPPRFLRRHIDRPFIGSVVSAWNDTSDGRRTFVVSTELGDSTVRKFDSEVLQAHSILLKPTVQKHTLAHYAQATGQDIGIVRNVPHQMVSLAFDPKSEANVIAWAATEHAHDGTYDTLVDIDEKTMREFDKPPDLGNVSSVDGFIRSMDAAAQALQQHDIHLDPQNDRQADQSEHHAKWEAARNKETDALFRNKVIASETATRAEIGRASVLSMKWVYKLKSDGTFKARLVIRGFTQREGDNTYDKDMVLSPTAHGPSVRILLASAVQLGRHVGTFDVANAFQQGEFIAGEVIFVRMPKNAGGDVRRLLTPLYGLKQSARSFQEKLTACLRELNFSRAFYESCLYTYEEVDASGKTQRLDILVHVDDGLYSTTDLEMKERKFAELGKELQFTDECELRTYLGVDYTYDRDKGICTASSEGYFRRSFQRLHLGFMLKPDFGASKCRDTPFDPAINLSPCDDDELYEEGTCPINMRVIVGVLSYAASTTRPDISYIVNVLASSVNDPRPKHVRAAYHMMCYIAGTIDMGIVYSRKKINNDHDWRLEAFSDADWASETTSRRSRTGIILMMCGAPMLWKSHLQATISLSTTEAEYNALVYMGCETLYFFRLLADLGQQRAIMSVLPRVPTRCAPNRAV